MLNSICRGLACFEAATLLLDTVTCMAAPTPQAGQKPPSHGSRDWVEEQYTQTAAGNVPLEVTSPNFTHNIL